MADVASLSKVFSHLNTMAATAASSPVAAASYLQSVGKPRDAEGNILEPGMPGYEDAVAAMKYSQRSAALGLTSVVNGVAQTPVALLDDAVSARVAKAIWPIAVVSALNEVNRLSQMLGDDYSSDTELLPAQAAQYVNAAGGILMGIGAVVSAIGGAAIAPWIAAIVGTAGAVLTLIGLSYPETAEEIAFYLRKVGDPVLLTMRSITAELGVISDATVSAAILEFSSPNIIKNAAEVIAMSPALQQSILLQQPLDMQNANLTEVASAETISYWEWRTALYLHKEGYSAFLEPKYKGVAFFVNKLAPNADDAVEGFLSGLANGKRVIFVDSGNQGESQAGSIDDQVFGGSDSNILKGEGGSDYLYGFAGNDVLDGGEGTDYLYGGTGDDWLGYTAASTSAGSLAERDSDGNYYEGGTGTDHIFGSVNADRIRFNQGDGTDIVTGNGGADILEYVANGGFLATSREGKNLVLSRTHVNGAVDRIVMQNWYADIPAESMRLARVDFGAIDPTTGLFVASGSLNGDILHEQGLHKQIGTTQELRGDLIAYQETLQGSEQSDWLYSSQAVDENSVGDILVGGLGDDYLYGSIGADKVRIGAGDGKDVFRGNGGADIVETYGGISITHMYTKLDKVGADLRATFIDGTQLTIRDWDVEGKLMAFREGRDGSLVGYDWVNQNLDNFYGDAGVNVIIGTTSANEFYGYGGADRLVGGGGNDKFWGGTGNDELVGNTGNDTFYYGLGDGIDHIWGGGGSDVLDFQASGQGRPLTALRVGNDIKFSYSASDSVTVHDWFSNAGAAMSVKLPNGQVMSSSQVNAGFNTTTMGWTSGVYNGQDFLAVLYSLNSNFKILDDQYKATWGKSFYAQAFNSMVKNYYNDTGVDINGSSVYSWGAGIGNAYATPGTIIYGDVWWNFWSNGNGGHNFAITQANAGRVLNGWSYDSGNPGGLTAHGHIDKALYYQYQNPMQAIPTTRDSFVAYDGSYAQASAMGVYDISSTSESGEGAELVGVSNTQMMYLA